MRKGRIRISEELYENHYDSVKVIFEYVRPIAIEYEYHRNNDYVIWGYSDEFDEVKEGEEIPLYDVTLATARFDKV
jgi:hypothetical protein